MKIWIDIFLFGDEMGVLGGQLITDRPARGAELLNQFIEANRADWDEQEWGSLAPADVVEYTIGQSKLPTMLSFSWEGQKYIAYVFELRD